MHIIMQVIDQPDKDTEFNAGGWAELLKTFIPALRTSTDKMYVCMTNEIFRMDRFIGLEYPTSGVATAIYGGGGDYYTTHTDWAAAVDFIIAALMSSEIDAIEITSSTTPEPESEIETELPLDVKPKKATRKKTT